MFFIKKTSSSTRRPEVASSRTNIANTGTSKRVVRTSVGLGVLTPTSAVRMQGSVKPLKAAGVFGVGVDNNVSTLVVPTEAVGLQPDTFIIGAIREADFRVNRAHRVNIPARINQRKDISAVPAVLFVPLSGAFLGRSCFS